MRWPGDDLEDDEPSYGAVARYLVLVVLVASSLIALLVVLWRNV